MDNQQPGPKPNEPVTSPGDPAAIHTLSQNGSGLSSQDEEKIASQELAGALIAAATDNLAIPEAIDAAVPGAAKPFDRERIADLIAQIKESADKLAADQPSRGDLKILSRTLRELRYAFKVFSPYRTRRKVTVFGSARTRPDKPTYQQAVAFGRKMAECGWLVVTGAASGIMEAGHVGAGRENSMGLNIMLPFEQSSNPIIAGDPKLVHMKYFFTRKLMFVKECDAVALFPGGFGTLDEGLEVLTLLQTGKRDMVPVVFLDEPGGKFWQPLIEFVHDRLLADGMISPEDLSLYKVTDSRRRRGARNSELLPRLPQHAVREEQTRAAAYQFDQPGIAGRYQHLVPRYFGRRPIHRRRSPARRKRRARFDRTAATDFPLQPPQPRPLAAVDRCAEQWSGRQGRR